MSDRDFLEGYDLGELRGFLDGAGAQRDLDDEETQPTVSGHVRKGLQCAAAFALFVTLVYLERSANKTPTETAHDEAPVASSRFTTVNADWKEAVVRKSELGFAGSPPRADIAPILGGEA